MNVVTGRMPRLGGRVRRVCRSLQCPVAHVRQLADETDLVAVGHREFQRVIDPRERRRVVADIEIGEARTVVQPHIIGEAVAQFPIEPVAGVSTAGEDVQLRDLGSRVGCAAVAQPDRLFPRGDRIVPVAASTVDLADLGPHLRHRNGVPRARVLGERYERVEPFVASRQRALDGCRQLEHRRRSAHHARLYDQAAPPQSTCSTLESRQTPSRPPRHEP
jgi:hypothetical protein